jgi:SAM-dependent methyltransferase
MYTAAKFHIKRFIKRLIHFDKRYYCPLCDSHLAQLLPFGHDSEIITHHKVVGAGYRENAACPTCGSIDRERLVYLYLKNETTLFSTPQKLLHLAPEKGIETRLKQAKLLDYLTADLRSPLAMVKMDITNIDYPSNSFDAIICNHVLEHVIADTQAMSELFRVLKPNGWALLQVPLSYTLKKTIEDPTITSETERFKAFGQADHVRLYGLDYMDRLEHVGFIVKSYAYPHAEKRYGGKINRYALNQDEQLIIARKPNR